MMMILLDWLLFRFKSWTFSEISDKI
jgi:hypothetical protein